MSNIISIGYRTYVNCNYIQDISPAGEEDKSFESLCIEGKKYKSKITFSNNWCCYSPYSPKTILRRIDIATKNR